MQWEREDEEGNWHAFDHRNSQLLDDAFIRGEPFECISSTVHNRPLVVVVSFVSYHAVQVNLATGTTRPVRRVSRTMWEARLDMLEWQSYEASVSTKIEDAFRTRMSHVDVDFAVEASRGRRFFYRIVFGPGEGLCESDAVYSRVRRTSSPILPSPSTTQPPPAALPSPTQAMPAFSTVVSSSPAVSNSTAPASSPFWRHSSALTERCCICLEMDPDQGWNVPVQLVKCNHAFHLACIQAAFKSKPICPLCKEAYDVITGNMPTNGSMNVHVLPAGQLPLGSYESYRTIVIEYDLPSGIQGAEHIHPGEHYHGTSRVAFLPDNQAGNEVLRLLKIAWDRRLTFTIGRSLTTGRENSIVWNGIHHKTCPTGGPGMFAFPDPGYFDRVKAELAAVGINAGESDGNS